MRYNKFALVFFAHAAKITCLCAIFAYAPTSNILDDSDENIVVDNTQQANAWIRDEAKDSKILVGDDRKDFLYSLSITEEPDLPALFHAKILVRSFFSRIALSEKNKVILLKEFNGGYENKVRFHMIIEKLMELGICAHIPSLKAIVIPDILHGQIKGIEANENIDKIISDYVSQIHTWIDNKDYEALADNGINIITFLHLVHCLKHQNTLAVKQMLKMTIEAISKYNDYWLFGTSAYQYFRLQMLALIAQTKANLHITSPKHQIAIKELYAQVNLAFKIFTLNDYGAITIQLNEQTGCVEISSSWFSKWLNITPRHIEAMQISAAKAYQLSFEHEALLDTHDLFSTSGCVMAMYKANELKHAKHFIGNCVRLGSQVYGTINDFLTFTNCIYSTIWITAVIILLIDYIKRHS